jgi:hypothetical protein
VSIEFAPFLPWTILAALAIAAALLSALSLWRGIRGAGLRTVALAALLMALANPLLMQEDREQLSTVVPIVVDRSQSQVMAGRQEQTDSALAGELTLANNRAVITIEGVRDKLRVLLVSGEPHPGERTWRNLLKADANVDLVHFTILRPPEKQDGTPINELSLIAFPTRELFQVKIKDFDLIIFDRYANQSILPLVYFDNIVRYVRDGGALLIAAGPEYSGAQSLARTPLGQILPAQPDGSVFDEAYRARVSEPGKRHPVTRDLPGSEVEPPRWGEWLRLVGARARSGSTVMTGPGDRPLLLLAREQKGRVALFLSDHAWLWARGFRDGGPHLDLLRRLGHWLMKEPDLEEEALRASARGRNIEIERQTLGENPAPATITHPALRRGGDVVAGRSLGIS